MTRRWNAFRHEMALSAYRRREAAEAERRARQEKLAAPLFWLLHHTFVTDPEPGQRPDTVLGDHIGILHKRAAGPMRFSGRTSEIRKEKWGTVVHAAINCREASPKMLRAAFTKMGKLQLRQMTSPDLKPVGLVLEPKVLNDGTVDMCCVIHDPVAARKVADRVYTSILLSMDGDEVASVDLIDSPAAFMEKRANPAILCKVYDGGVMTDWKRAKKLSKVNGRSRMENYLGLQRERMVKASPALAPLPASAAAVLAEQTRIDDLRKNGADGFLVKQLQDRNSAAKSLELVKAAQARPTAYGDMQLINMLRHGRP